MKRLMKQLRVWLRRPPPRAPDRPYGYEAAWPSLEAVAIRTAPPEAQAALWKEVEAQIETR